MLKTVLAFLFCVTGLMAQAKPVQDQINPVKELIDAARTDSPGLKELLEATDAFGRRVPELAGRDGVAVWGQEFVFAVESASPASGSIDNEPPIAMKRVPGTNYWYLWKMLRLGTTHRNQYMADGRNLGAAYE